jgi:hypothetical protein
MDIACMSSLSANQAADNQQRNEILLNKEEIVHTILII